MAEPWTSAPGVIEMPDGTRVRGRGLRAGLPFGELPTFGVYLLGREPPRVDWKTRWLEWPDFRLPRDRAAAIDVLAGVPAGDAVDYIRTRYDRRAVETPFQRRFVRRFGPAAEATSDRRDHG